VATLNLIPVSFSEACNYVKKFHRHNKPPVGHKFSIGLEFENKLIGVIMVGRPVSRHLDDGLTLEVNRCCTDGTKNSCSMLYGAAWRAGKNLGYKKIVTYTLEHESGSSLRGAGWINDHILPGASWSRPSRERVDQTMQLVNKLRWVKI
jgi:hypothetical protein